MGPDSLRENICELISKVDICCLHQIDVVIKSKCRFLGPALNLLTQLLGVGFRLFPQHLSPRKLVSVFSVQEQGLEATDLCMHSTPAKMAQTENGYGFKENI